MFVIFELCSSKKGPGGRETERKHHLTPESAWLLLNRIRAAMKPGQPTSMLTGRIVVDKSWLGGRPVNRDGFKAGIGGQGRTQKTPLVPSSPARLARSGPRPWRP